MLVSEDSVSFRPYQHDKDALRIEGFDASYETDFTYNVVQNGLCFSLHQSELRETFKKQYSITDIAADLRDAYAAWLAENADGTLAGLATVQYQEWNRSVLITGIFVACASKKQGIGHTFMELISSYARTKSARCLLLETQNTNVPAIGFYSKEGFALCGINTALYDPDQVKAGEVALYFTRALT